MLQMFGASRLVDAVGARSWKPSPHEPLDALKPLPRQPAVFFRELDAEIAAPGECCRYQCAAGPRKRIEHDPVRRREGLDQRLDDADHLLGRVREIAGVFPPLHIGERV